MLERLIQWLVLMARGRKLSGFGSISAQRALVQLAQRGGLAFIRGAVRRLTLGDAKGPFFIGRGVRILASSQLFVERSVFIGDYSYINCYSIRGVRLGCNVTIREFAWLQITSRLDNPGVGIEIGEGTYIGPRVVLGAAGLLRIGNRCQIGANVSFIAESHKFLGGSKISEQGVTRKGIVVGDDCWIGNNVIVLDGVEIGSGAVIGAGALVNRSIPPNMVAVGTPARVLRAR